MKKSTFTEARAAMVPVMILISWMVGCSSPGAPDRLAVDTPQTRAKPVIVTQDDPEEETEDAETIRETEKQALRYRLRRIGELLGQTAQQNSFTDFPYDALSYDLLEPRSNWITDDNMDADDTFIAFDSASVERGDGWTEHSMTRSRPAAAQEDVDAAKEVADAAETVATAAEVAADTALAAAILAGTDAAAEAAATAQAEAHAARAAADAAAEAYAAVVALVDKSISETITAYSDAVPALDIARAEAERLAAILAALEALAIATGTSTAEAEAAREAAQAAVAVVTAIESGTTPEDPGTEDVDDPWVHFGWWLEMSEDVEPPGYKFATFVDGGNRYSLSDLQDVVTGTAQYEGPAAGVYVKREPTTLNTHGSRFNAKVSLTAEFHGANDFNNQVLSLQGGISNFVDSDSETALHDWSATLSLNKYTSEADDADSLFGSVVVSAPGFDTEGSALYGTWQAHFHEGSEWYKGSGLAGVPGTVAGQFRAFRPSVSADASPSDSGYFHQPIVQSDSSRHFDDGGFLGMAGAFGAHLRTYSIAH